MLASSAAVSYCLFVKEGNVSTLVIYRNQGIVDLNNYPPMIDYETSLVTTPPTKTSCDGQDNAGLSKNTTREQ